MSIWCQARAGARRVARQVRARCIEHIELQGRARVARERREGLARGPKPGPHPQGTWMTYSWAAPWGNRSSLAVRSVSTPGPDKNVNPLRSTIP